MRQDYTEALAAMEAEISGMLCQLEALRLRWQLRSADLGNLREEAEDAEAWKAASKAQRATIVALDADVLAHMKCAGWQQGGHVRARLVDLRLVRKMDGRHQVTALGKAARAYARRGPEWCGMPGQLFGGAP